MRPIPSLASEIHSQSAETGGLRGSATKSSLRQPIEQAFSFDAEVVEHGVGVLLGELLTVAAPWPFDLQFCGPGLLDGTQRFGLLVYCLVTRTWPGVPCDRPTEGATG